jgi:hypothetical protein
MVHTVKERRADARFTSPLIDRIRLVVRPGCSVTLLDLSAGGALVHSPRPLRPGTRVQMHLVTTAHRVALRAHVQRCVVALLDPEQGVVYCGALQFDERCEIPWEDRSRRGYRVPGARSSATNW